MTKLIGTNPNQVPSNGDLGTAAFADVKDFLLSRGSNLAAINASITSTSVNHVFIYDTSNDSDGGAWRKRTFNTSWYNEELNTPTRGSRKEFPAVALIVTEQFKVTIYDLDDPNVSMWMVFHAGSNNLIGNNVSNLWQSHMLNGMLMTGKNGGSAGFSIVDFIAEENVGIWRASAGYYYLYRGAVSQRNDEMAFNNYNDSSKATIGAQIYAVHMALEPNAKVNPSTGLPYPTLLAGTDLGLSVIKNFENVYDLYNGSDAYDDIREISVQDGVIFWSVNATQVAYSYKLEDITSDLNFSSYSSHTTGSTTRGLFMTQEHGGQTQSAFPVRVMGINASNNLHVAKDAVGSYEGSSLYEPGLAIIKQNEATLQNDDAMSAFITSSYNTGYMPGYMSNAGLGDVRTDSLSGKTYLTNGTFDSSMTGWSTSSGDGLSRFSIVSGRAYLDGRTSGGYDQIYQDIPTVPGEEYIVSFEIEPVANYPYYAVYARSGGSNVTIAGDQMHTSQGYVMGRKYPIQVGFKATTDTTRVLIGGNSPYGDRAYYDNIFVQKATLDRRYYDQNGDRGWMGYRVDTISGNIPRKRVAPGAELVGYGPMSDGNRLVQDSNYLLDTMFNGDFTCLAWVKKDSRTTNTYVYDNISLNNTSSAYRSYFLIDNSNGWYWSGGGPASSLAITIKDGEWNLVMVTRNNNEVRFGHNGEWYTPSTNSTNSSTVTIDGARRLWVSGYNGTWNYDYSWDSIALFRLSRTAITEDQFKKIWRDEFKMFQPYSRVTIHGGDDGVRALNRDPYTQDLHVGTAAGKSVFQGLTRVSESNEPVTKFISANKGTVAED
jgi:hypothetical protein